MTFRISRQAADGPPLTLKLSVFENAGMKPWKHPWPHELSTFVGSPLKLPTGVIQTL
jgi:hypothetical protein